MTSNTKFRSLLKRRLCLILHNRVYPSQTMNMHSDFYHLLQTHPGILIQFRLFQERLKAALTQRISWCCRLTCTWHELSLLYLYVKFHFLLRYLLMVVLDMLPTSGKVESSFCLTLLLVMLSPEFFLTKSLIHSIWSSDSFYLDL